MDRSADFRCCWIWTRLRGLTLKRGVCHSPKFLRQKSGSTFKLIQGARFILRFVSSRLCLLTALQILKKPLLPDQRLGSDRTLDTAGETVSPPCPNCYSRGKRMPEEGSLASPFTRPQRMWHTQAHYISVFHHSPGFYEAIPNTFHACHRCTEDCIHCVKQATATN